MATTTMDEKVLAALTKIAPECEGAAVDKDLNLQEQFDIDSIDMIHFIEMLQNQFHVSIPSEAYKTFLTINGAAQYLEDHLAI